MPKAASPVAVMAAVIASQLTDPKWKNAPLGLIKSLPNTNVGVAGQDFVKEWCKLKRLRWEKADRTQSPWDAKILGMTFEVKTATEDVNGNFQFNHIRHHREYQAVLCLGVCPADVLFGAWTKGEIAEGKAGRLVTMDRGSSATFKLTKRKPDLLPMSEFAKTIRRLATKT